MPKYNDFDLDLQTEQNTLNKDHFIFSRTSCVTCDGANSVCILCPHTEEPECKTEYCPSK